jgi:hypothetical protein
MIFADVFATILVIVGTAITLIVILDVFFDGNLD